jgi:hypothetical protein
MYDKKPRWMGNSPEYSGPGFKAGFSFVIQVDLHNYWLFGNIAKSPKKSTCFFVTGQQTGPGTTQPSKQPSTFVGMGKDINNEKQ